MSVYPTEAMKDQCVHKDSIEGVSGDRAVVSYARLSLELSRSKSPTHPTPLPRSSSMLYQPLDGEQADLGSAIAPTLLAVPLYHNLKQAPTSKNRWTRHTSPRCPE